jgi:hypothetical protein
MRNFKFLSTDEDAVEPIEPYQSETPQIYTEILRLDIPINEMTETDLNRIKYNQEQLLLHQISNTLDFRHEIIYVDGNGFTLRSELFF